MNLFSLKGQNGVRVAVLFLLGAPFVTAQQPAPQQRMTFFVTSEGSGKGADLGGLKGADQRCQMLATAVGAGDRTWHAYLSTQATGNQPAINARDRIGTGPLVQLQGSPHRERPWRSPRGYARAGTARQQSDENHGTH